MKEFALMPDPGGPLPKRAAEGIDHERHRTETRVAVQRPLSRFLNGEEIVATRKASLVEGPA